MLPTSHFCMIFPTVMNLPSVGVFSCKRIAAQFLTFVPSFLNPSVRTNSLYGNRTVVFFFLSPHTPCGRVRHAREALTLLSFYSKPIGPLQLAIHVVQNRRAGEQKSHRDKTNKENYHFKSCMSCLSCPSATFAHQRGGFVPREWLAAKGLSYPN